MLEGTSVEQKFVKRNLSESIPLRRAAYYHRDERGEKEWPSVTFTFLFPLPFFFFFVYFGVFGKQTPVPRNCLSFSLSLSFLSFFHGRSRGATGGNYRRPGQSWCRFALATVSLTFIPLHMVVSVFGIRVDVSCSLRCVAAGRRLSVSSLPIPILTAPPSRLVWSRPSLPSRPVTAQIRSVPSRPVPSSRPRPVPTRRLVSPRLASPRFVSLRHGSPVPPVRSCGHVDRSLPCNEIRSPSVSP